MRKIALIMDGWKRYLTFAWPAGILQRIHETGEEVNLYIFNSSGNWSRDEEYNAGEYNIYRLPELDQFDGIILDLTNITSKAVREEVITRAKNAGKPVISIADRIENFYYVGIDNFNAMRKMIEHLWEVHNCRKYWFIMGPKEHYENKKRANAVKSFLEKKKFAFSERDFYYENFGYQCGVHGFEHMLQSHEEIPDAIVCASDNIAVGVCEAARTHGYHVPEDFCVTGFDNFDKAAYFLPQISTVGHIREKVGYRCADLFLRLWAGETVPKYNYAEVEHIYWESCGCKSAVVLDERKHLKDQIMYDIETSEFSEEILALESELIKCNTVEEMMYCIPHCIPSMRCDAIWLVLDDCIDAFKNLEEFWNPHQELMGEGFRTVGYPAKMRVRFAYENGKVLDTTAMEIENIFPMFDTAEGGKDFLFLPLHFRNYAVGYLVIRNAMYLMEKQYLFRIMNALVTAMENLHKKEKLEYMNQALSKLYVKDSMTGMYNRLGYQKIAASYFERMKEEKRKMLIMFADLDRLKYINDNFGHEYGDFAIMTIAKTILKYCDKDAVPARIGGDEFVLVQLAGTMEEKNELVDNVYEDVQRISEQMNLPFELSVSIGTIITEPDTGRTLEDYVREADEIMYQEKVKKKVNREN